MDGAAGARSVRTRSYAPADGSRNRRVRARVPRRSRARDEDDAPLAIAGIVVGAFCALIVIQANEPFVAFASFALIALAGLVVDSVRETVGLLLGR